MSNEAYKSCPFCMEDVRTEARKCRHCHQWLGRWTGSPNLPIAFAFLVLLGFWGWAEFRVGRPVLWDFAEHRDELVITNARFDFTREDDGLYVSTYGMIRNESAIAWKDLLIEVRYFDSDAELIDTTSAQRYTLTLHPGAEAAFRLRKRADKPQASYAGHHVLVLSAQDARSRF